MSEASQPVAASPVLVRTLETERPPRVRETRGDDPDFPRKCPRYSLINLFVWCPAYAALETGGMDEWVECFYEVADARATAAGAGAENMGYGAIEPLK